VVLCIGDFFGPVKEDGTTDNPEVAQLLDGDIVGTLVYLVPCFYVLTIRTLCSSISVLLDARGMPSTVSRDREVRVNSGRDCQERVPVECARMRPFKARRLTQIR
jgi:hypothetical protein